MLNSILNKYSNMNGSSQIILFLIVLVILMLICICIINIITKKRNKELNENNKSKKYIEIIDDTVEKELQKEPINIKEEKKDRFEKMEELEEEIEELNFEPEEVKIVSKKSSIEEIAQMMEAQKQKPIDLTKFEEDQEENAIISYDELVKRAGAKKIIYKTEEEPIKSREEIIAKVDEDLNKSKFKASRVISPIYGIQKENKVEEKDEVLDSFIELERQQQRRNDSIKEMSDVEFLGSLKKFRSELE